MKNPKKYARCTFHPIAGKLLPNFMKFGLRYQLTDIIAFVKFLINRFRGYGVLTPPKLPFHIDLLRRPYDSVIRTAVRHCDCVMLTGKVCLFETATTYKLACVKLNAQHLVKLHRVYTVEDKGENLDNNSTTVRRNSLSHEYHI